MHGSMTAPANHGEIFSRMIRVIFIDVVNVNLILAAVSAAARLACKVCFIESIKSGLSVFAKQAADALAFERISKMLLTIKRRSFRQWLRTHRAFAGFLGVCSFASHSVALKIQTLLTLGNSKFGFMSAASLAKAASYSVNLPNGVYMKSEFFSGFWNAVRPLKALNDRGSINLGSTRHGMAPIFLLRANESVHVTTIHPGKLANTAAFIVK